MWSNVDKFSSFYIADHCWSQIAYNQSLTDGSFIEILQLLKDFKKKKEFVSLSALHITNTNVQFESTKWIYATKGPIVV